jgi:hypothetical protein
MDFKGSIDHHGFCGSGLIFVDFMSAHSAIVDFMSAHPAIVDSMDAHSAIVDFMSAFIS